MFVRGSELSDAAKTYSTCPTDDVGKFKFVNRCIDGLAALAEPNLRSGRVLFGVDCQHSWDRSCDLTIHYAGSRSTRVNTKFDEAKWPIDAAFGGRPCRNGRERTNIFRHDVGTSWEGP